MLKTPLLMNRRSPTSAPTPGRKGKGNRVVNRLRFNRTIGFWLGGVVLGTAGCIIGASVPYDHPVAVTASMLWWGIYIGSFGGSVGALIGVLTESISAAPSRDSDRTANPLSEEDNWVFPVAGNALVNDAPLKARAVSHCQPADGAVGGVAR
jgi:hypothetical protein